MINRPAVSSVGGRGLGIVDRLCVRWGVYAGSDGSETTVWAALPRTGDRGPTTDAAAEPHFVIASSHDA